MIKIGSIVQFIFAGASRKGTVLRTEDMGAKILYWVKDGKRRYPVYDVKEIKNN